MGDDRLAAAYDEFEAAERDSRKLIESTPRFAAYPDHRAQGYASLAEARSMAYSWAIASRTEHARLHAHTSLYSTVSSLGQPCQDMRYAVSVLDGRRTYRLQGRLGECRLALLQMHNRIMGHPDSHEIGNYDLTDLAAADGTIDVLVSGDPQADGPCIRLDPDSEHNFVLARRIVATITDDPGELRLVEQTEPDGLSEIDLHHMADRVGWAADLLRYLVRDWAVGLYDLYLGKAGGLKNRFSYIPGKDLADRGGSATNTYGFCVYELAPDEALLLEWEPVESAYWSWQLGDVWSNALDFFNYQTDLNMNTAALDADGKVRVVVCASDPGVPNWLDIRGRREGVVVFRNYKERSESSAPTARTIGLSRLREELPPGTPLTSADERADVLAARRLAYRRAFGE